WVAGFARAARARGGPPPGVVGPPAAGPVIRDGAARRAGARAGAVQRWAHPRDAVAPVRHEVSPAPRRAGHRLPWSDIRGDVRGRADGRRRRGTGLPRAPHATRLPWRV